MKRSTFDALVARARGPLRSQRARAAAVAGVESAGLALLLGAIAFLLARQAGFAWGAFPLGLVLILGPAFLWIVAGWATERFGPVSRGLALERTDEAAAAAGRLRAADEFLDAKDGFRQAAVEDAQRFVEAAERARLAQAEATTVVWPWREIGLSALVVLLAFLMPHAKGGGSKDAIAEWPGPEAEPARKVAADTPARDDAGARKPQPAATRKRTEKREASKVTTATRYAQDQTRATRGTKARSRAGQAGEGGSPSRAVGAPGAPSEQDPEAKTGTKPKPTKRDRKNETAKPAPTPKPSDNKEKSGSTAGQGSRGGTTKNPTTTSWSSKDKVPNEDQENLESDDDVEDEDSDSEARGGVQPNLRDRKPPVNRDLSIGFGNRKSPQANGRGGPSQRKKSRGTASLVLGVPIPDHVRGNPNPGRTKVTQERVEPRAEESKPAPIESRRPRRRASGAVATPDTPPWLQRILHKYFLTQREGAGEAASAPKDSE